jgi:hypothetical protein
VKLPVRIAIIAVLAVLGTAFLLYGTLFGQALTVLRKATHICLECIGIG